MAISDIDKVRTFLQGVADRDPDLATSHVHPQNYTEHDSRVAEGIEGLRRYIHALPRKDHRLNVVRAFADGPFVFTQEEGSIRGRNVFFDIFRFEDGLIAEHWVFSAGGAPPNKSGHTQTDGPTQADPSANTERSKSFIRHYYETVHVGGDHSNLQQYFNGDRCIRHEPGVVDGVPAFTRDLGILTRTRSINEIKFLFGAGDFVLIAAKGTHEGAACSYVDLYRVESDVIAERWGFSEDVPPREERKNNNGVL